MSERPQPLEWLEASLTWLETRRQQTLRMWVTTISCLPEACQLVRLQWKALTCASVITLSAVMALSFVCTFVIFVYGEYYKQLTPLLTLCAGLALAAVALMRHFAQTDADRQRRITESFSKAIEQLGSDKPEIRLGGIYSLERISKKSVDDYWAIMETLSSFIRESSRRVKEQLAQASEEEKVERLPETDISAALTVIKRRLKSGQEREEANALRFDLSGALSTRVDLKSVILKRANLSGSNFEDSDFTGAFLEGADFTKAHLKRIVFYQAHLEDAIFNQANLECANLWEAHLERAHLVEAYLEAGNLQSAHLEHANLGKAHLKSVRLIYTHLENANLFLAHLEAANAAHAHFECAILNKAHFERANLWEAHFEGAQLWDTHLEGAVLGGAYFKGALFYSGAHLEGADLTGAHLEGADLSQTIGLSQAQINKANGDSSTKLPEGMIRPDHWPQAPDDWRPAPPYVSPAGTFLGSPDKLA